MNKRKIAIIVGAVCVLAIVGAFAVSWRYETKIRGDIEDFLANLPPSIRISAEKIDVSFFKKSVTLSNIKGEYSITVPRKGKEETIPMAFTTDRLSAVGVNLDGFKEGAGVAKLLDSLTWENARIDSAVAQADIASYYVTDISGDFSLLYTEIVKALPVLMATSSKPGDPEEALRALASMAGILKAYETFHIGQASIKNYNYFLDFEGEKIGTRIESVALKDYSIRKMGPFAMHNMTVSHNGKSLLQMEELASDEILLPSFVGLCEMLAANPDPAPEMIQAAFKGQPFALKNMRLKNMTVQHPMAENLSLFSLADMNFSYVAETAHTMDFTFNDLAFAKALLVEESGMPEQIFASLPETLSLEGAFQTVSTPKENNTFDAAFKNIFLKGTGMGEATLAFAAKDINVMALAMGMPNRSALENFDLSVTDNGLSDVLFALDGFSNGTTPVEARAEKVNLLRGQVENSQNQVDKDLFNGLVAFLEKAGGTLKIAVKPKTPSTFQQLMQAYMMDPAALGLTITSSQAE